MACFFRAYQCNRATELDATAPVGREIVGFNPFAWQHGWVSLYKSNLIVSAKPENLRGLRRGFAIELREPPRRLFHGLIDYSHFRFVSSNTASYTATVWRAVSRQEKRAARSGPRSRQRA